jgi:hypothetical protein
MKRGTSVNTAVSECNSKQLHARQRHDQWVKLSIMKHMTGKCIFSCIKHSLSLHIPRIRPRPRLALLSVLQCLACPKYSYFFGQQHHLVHLSIYLWLYSPLLDLGRFFSFIILYTVGRTPWTWDQPVARPLSTHTITEAQNIQTSMPWLGSEHTIPAFKRAKTVHDLDRAATVICPPNA